MNSQPTAKLTEPTTDETRAAKLTEPTTNENGARKESSSPTPTLLMFNAAGAGACTGDRYTAREG
jgi:hypothetical protein